MKVQVDLSHQLNLAQLTTKRYQKDAQQFLLTVHIFLWNEYMS